MRRGKVDVLMGLQRGDEGKGRFIDILAQYYWAIARFNGGPNAGHTVVIDGVEINLHQIPSGIMQDHIVNLITHTSLFDPVAFIKERGNLQLHGYSVNPDNLKIGWNAQIIMPHHIMFDALAEKTKNSHGSTQRGVAPAAASRFLKTGGTAELIARGDFSELGRIAMEGLAEYNSKARRRKDFGSVDRREIVDEWLSSIEESDIAAMVCNTDDVVNDLLGDGKSILAEGAQAAMLDITRGRVNRTTSSHPGLVGALDGLGISHRDLGKVTGVFKYFPTQVGKGHNTTLIEDKSIVDVLIGEDGAPDQEKGKTSGRERPPGWLDLAVLRSAVNRNGVTELIGTKLDKAEELKRKVGIEVIKIAMDYIDRSGTICLESPPSEYRAIEMLPRYEEFKIWEGSIVNIKQRKDLPVEAENIINTVERAVGHHIIYNGVGYERDQYIADLKH